MKKILVVDDTVVNLKMAERVLKDIPDVRPVPVPSGRRALDFAAKNVPDLILLDIMMPEMDGFETLAELRKLEGLAKVPVLFLTGDTEPDTLARVAEADAAGLVAKPFKREELLQKVTELLQGGE